MTDRIFTGEVLSEDLSDEEVVPYLRAVSAANAGNVNIVSKHLGQIVRLGKSTSKWRSNMGSASEADRYLSVHVASILEMLKVYDANLEKELLSANEGEDLAKLAYNVFDKEAIARFPDRIRTPWDAADERVQEIFRILVTNISSEFKARRGIK